MMNEQPLSERDELINSISDTYKEVNGFRPRFCNFNEMPLLELQLWQQGLQAEVEQQLEDEKIHQGIVMALSTPQSGFTIGDLLKI